MRLRDIIDKETISIDLRKVYEEYKINRKAFPVSWQISSSYLPPSSINTLNLIISSEMQKDLELYDKEESIKKLISFTSVKLKREMNVNIVVNE